MEQSSINYRYASKLLERFNGLVESNNSLAQLFLWRGINLWQSYQATIFLDAKNWSKEKKFSQSKQTLAASLKLFLVLSVLFLISLTASLYAVLSRKSFWIFTEDKTEGKFKNDLRLESLYQALGEDRVAFFEVVHTLSDRTAFKNLRRRGRGILYLESIDFAVSGLVWFEKRKAREFIGAVDLASFDEGEKAFVRFELEKLISMRLITKTRFRILGFLIKISGAKTLLAIDDTRHYHEFVGAGKLGGIPTYAIQHGHFTKYHVGWLKKTQLKGEVLRPDFLIVWSEYWRQELIRLGTYFSPEEIMVGGGAEASGLVERVDDGFIGILVPYEKDAPKAEVRDFILKLLAEPNFKVIFKIRADQSEESQLEEYALLPLRSQITVTSSLSEALPKVDVAVGTYSTLLYDFVSWERPVAIVETSLDYGEGMIKNGLADFIKAGEDPVAVIKQLVKTSRVVLVNRKDKLTSSKRLSETLRAIIRQYVSN